MMMEEFELMWGTGGDYFVLGLLVLLFFVVVTARAIGSKDGRSKNSRGDR